MGSSNVITDEQGVQAGLTEFTPYGSTFKHTGTYDPKYKFTGKELDASTGMYFYGARYYDPQLGRFISADTIVQSPYDPQSLNRYSYCRNNPINLIDPSGHFFWFFAFLIGVIKGAIVGSLIGGAIAAITGQNLAQGFLTGAISGALFGGVGGLGLKGLAHTVGHTLAGAASGAANAQVTGGDVGMNALIGGISAGASEFLGNNVGPLQDVAGTGLGAHLTNMLRRAFIGSVIGGAVSAATGGSFGRGAAQGATTSAIGYAANEALHEMAEQAQKALNTQQDIKQTDDLYQKYLNNSLSKKGYVEAGANVGLGKYGVTFGVKIAPKGVYLYYGAGEGLGTGASITYNIGNVPSAGLSFSGSASGGDVVGFRYRVTYGKTGQSVTFGAGAGIGLGQNVCETHTVQVYPEIKFSE